MKYAIICLAVFAHLGCSTVPVTELDLSAVPFCDYRHVPAGTAEKLEDDADGVALSCSDSGEVKPVADIKVMPYAPLHAKIVGMIIIKKSLSYEPYCRMIGANIIVLRHYNQFIRKGYVIYDAYYSD